MAVVLDRKVVNKASRRPAGFRVCRAFAGVADALGLHVVALGKVDGLHLGHLGRCGTAPVRLAGSARRTWQSRSAHLRGGPAPPVMTSLGEKLRLFRDAGAQFVVLLPADATVLNIPAEQFARDMLYIRMGPARPASAPVRAGARSGLVVRGDDGLICRVSPGTDDGHPDAISA